MNLFLKPKKSTKSRPLNSRQTPCDSKTSLEMSHPNPVWLPLTSVDQRLHPGSHVSQELRISRCGAAARCGPNPKLLGSLGGMQRRVSAANSRRSVKHTTG